MRGLLLALLPLALLVSAPAAHARNRTDARSGYQALQAAVAADLEKGKPLVVQVHVPLCDRRIIRCGNRRLGDGDNPGTNLYWTTSGGFVGWFGRRGSGWRQVARQRGDGDILEVRVWRRRFRAAGALAGPGGGDELTVYVVAHAWRGTAIRRAMDSYVRDLHGEEPRLVTLDDGTELAAGGAARLVAFVGHNGWMDVDDYDFDEVVRGTRRSTRRKGTLAVACITEDYLAGALGAPDRVPLLMTRWLLFAGAHSLEGAVSAFARGQSLAAVRQGAIRAYARGQGKSVRTVSGAFTNPADRRWKGRSE